MPNPEKDLKRGFWQRLLGKPATPLPQNPDCWSHADNRITVDLSRAPELSAPGGALRIESESLPQRVLLIHGDDGNFHAFHNCCTHGKRRLDPVPGAETVQCCSIGKSTFTYDGKLQRGSAKEDIPIYPITVGDGKVVVELS